MCPQTNRIGLNDKDRLSDTNIFFIFFLNRITSKKRSGRMTDFGVFLFKSKGSSTLIDVRVALAWFAASDYSGQLIGEYDIAVISELYSIA